ncbi:MAG: hypothetical protein ABJB66_10300, partial [Gemmatimonadaceae bacterium]
MTQRFARLLPTVAVALTTLLSACASVNSAGTSPNASRPEAKGPIADARWADSVLATLSLRDKAAQMVWVWTLGDYTAVDNSAWTNIEKLIHDEHLGGAIISV